MKNAHTAPSVLAPFWLNAQPISINFLAVALGTPFLTAASWIEMPMIPVPMNMQTFAVATLGALYGWRLGAITVLLWLGEGAIGLPVFSDGAAGILHFVGPTGGYLLACPLMASLIGWLVDKGWVSDSIVRLFIAMLAGQAVCLTLGALWLAIMIGGKQALMVGAVPFLLSSVLKSALVAITAATVRRAIQSAAHRL